jgi:hypothetical protein
MGSQTLDDESHRHLYSKYCKRLCSTCWNSLGLWQSCLLCHHFPEHFFPLFCWVVVVICQRVCLGRNDAPWQNTHIKNWVGVRQRRPSSSFTLLYHPLFLLFGIITFPTRPLSLSHSRLPAEKSLLIFESEQPTTHTHRHRRTQDKTFGGFLVKGRNKFCLREFKEFPHVIGLGSFRLCDPAQTSKDLSAGLLSIVKRGEAACAYAGKVGARSIRLVV